MEPLRHSRRGGRELSPQLPGTPSGAGETQPGGQPKDGDGGPPNSWLVSLVENPNLNWMITRFIVENPRKNWMI